MNEKLEKEIKHLLDGRIWITKKARMEAEARMNQNHLFYQFIVNYYTFLVLAFSIWSLVSKDDNISILTVIASVGLFGLSIFLNAIGYREKAIGYKESYLSLGELESELKHLLRSNSHDENDIINKIREYEKQYTNILSKSENHSDIDYYSVLIKHKMQIHINGIIKYYTYKGMSILFKMLLILIPLFSIYVLIE
jgi:hypothetical protein